MTLSGSAFNKPSFSPRSLSVKCLGTSISTVQVELFYKFRGI